MLYFVEIRLDGATVSGAVKLTVWYRTDCGDARRMSLSSGSMDLIFGIPANQSLSRLLSFPPLKV